jgi:nicotinate-nucleotide adenylyltransferase
MNDHWQTKVGLFLGSFNPFHQGHLRVIQEAKKRGLHTIWIIPAMENPWKTEKPVTIDHRFWLAHYEIQKEKDARVLLVITEPDPEDGKYYSVDQLKKILRGYGSRNFQFWIVGGNDTISQIENWKDGDWILKNFKIMEIQRPGFSNNLEKGHRTLEISSTQIREWIKTENPEVKKWLTQDSLNYIKKYGLYN